MLIFLLIPLPTVINSQQQNLSNNVFDLCCPIFTLFTNEQRKQSSKLAYVYACHKLLPITTFVRSPFLHQLAVVRQTIILSEHFFEHLLLNIFSYFSFKLFYPTTEDERGKCTRDRKQSAPVAPLFSGVSDLSVCHRSLLFQSCHTFPTFISQSFIYLCKLFQTVLCSRDNQVRN